MFQPYPITVVQANGRAVDMICVAMAKGPDGEDLPCLYDPETDTYSVAEDGLFEKFPE